MVHGSILQYFPLSYDLSLRSLFGLFLSGRFTQVLQYNFKSLCTYIFSGVQDYGGLGFNIMGQVKPCPGLQLRVRTNILIFLFLNKTYVVGAQKNRLNETVLLSTQNIC